MVRTGRERVDEWAGARPITERTLRRAFAAQLTPSERALWQGGENARRDAQTYLSRPPSVRNQVWEADHKQLPILALPPRGGAVRPWMTTIVDDATRALVGWSIALTPTPEPSWRPCGPAWSKTPSGARSAPCRRWCVSTAAWSSPPARSPTPWPPWGWTCTGCPAYTPHRKGRVERFHRTLEQMLLSTLPGFTGGPRDTAGRLSDDHLAELAYAPVRFPPPARPLPAAHRACRIAAAGRSTAWLFPSADDPKKPTSPGALRTAARDLARDIAVHASRMGTTMAQPPHRRTPDPRTGPGFLPGLKAGASSRRKR